MLRSLLTFTIAIALGDAASTAEQDGAITYSTDTDISYLEKGNEVTPYQAERCRLDVYYSNNRTGFATLPCSLIL